MHNTIRELRKQKGFTQQQVADHLQIDRSTYAYYESGRSRLSINIVVDLAHLFQVSYATGAVTGYWIVGRICRSGGKHGMVMVMKMKSRTYNHQKGHLTKIRSL